MGSKPKPPDARRSIQLFVKRVFDIIVAATGLTVLSPLLALVSVAIKLDSRGPILVRHIQYWYDGRRVHVINFRCRAFVRADDEDVTTNIGRILSRSGIERLPMLLNVLRGEMSIVGPCSYVAPPSILLAGVLPDALPRSKLRPGLLCRAKINVPRNPDVGSYLRQQIADDLLYTTNWSLSLDVNIILRILTSKTSYNFN
jgi:lipopolysaccharide/colanic/teichoic acid biosynthesis glycosyltransferase